MAPEGTSHGTASNGLLTGETSRRTGRFSKAVGVAAVGRVMRGGGKRERLGEGSLGMDEPLRASGMRILRSRVTLLGPVPTAASRPDMCSSSSASTSIFKYHSRPGQVLFSDILRYQRPTECILFARDVGIFWRGREHKGCLRASETSCSRQI